MTIVAPALIGGLSDDERDVVTVLLQQLAVKAEPNHVARAYYEADQTVRYMGVTIPPEVARRVQAVVGWGGTVVDVIEERLDWLGWTESGDDTLGLPEIFAQNRLAAEGSFGHLDSLMYGVSFARVGNGSDGEPSPLITLHSPLDTTGIWNPRARRLDSALTIIARDVNSLAPSEVVLDVPGVTVTARLSQGHWRVVNRDEHGLPVPVVRLPNRPRGSRQGGRSEITRAVRYYCDAATRTLLGMETNRDFYGIPQLTLLGRGQDAFVDGQGNPTSAWKTLAGHAIALPDDDDATPGNERAEIGQLQVSSPQPFLDQARGWAQLLAAEVGIPTSYLGFVTENPASADAIRAGEARLVKRVERRQTAFGMAWMDVARLALMIRDGSVPDDFWSRVSCRWRDAATPTRAATADETVKYVGSGILPADSQVTWDRMGLTPPEQQRLREDQSRARATANIQALVGGGAVAAGPAETPPESATDVKAKADALSVLIRAGVAADEAAARVGLTGLEFTGAIPVSLRPPVEDAAKLEAKNGEPV